MHLNCEQCGCIWKLETKPCVLRLGLAKRKRQIYPLILAINNKQNQTTVYTIHRLHIAYLYGSSKWQICQQICMFTQPTHTDLSFVSLSLSLVEIYFTCSVFLTKNVKKKSYRRCKNQT